MHDTTSDHPLYQNPSLRTMDVTLILSSLHGSATEQVTFLEWSSLVHSYAQPLEFLLSSVNMNSKSG